MAVTAISVPGVDLGKNRRSVVGLDAARRGGDAPQGEARDPDRACGELPPCTVGMEAAAGPIISAGCSPPAVMTSG